MSEVFLIVGLGNPGSSYDGTRHNVGFELIDFLAKKHNVILQEKKRLKSLIGKTTVEGVEVILVKPITFMNLSGIAVKKCANFYNIPSSHIIILVDDVDLLLGEIRLKVNGGAGTHNGLRDIQDRLRTKEYIRIRVGIGDQKSHDLEKYVLERFLPEERKYIEQALQKGVKSIEILFKQGIEKAMNFANTKVKRIQVK